MDPASRRAAPGSTAVAPGSEDSPNTRRTWLRRFGAIAGLALLVAAILQVASQRDVLTAALDTLAAGSPVRLVMLPLCVVGNVLLTGLVFSALMSRYGRVGLFEMQALLASATLINYLPLRPGLVGRVAYHQVVNDIPAFDTAKVVVQALVLSSSIAAYLAIVAWTWRAFGGALWVGVALPVPLLLVSMSLRTVRAWALAALFRYADMLLWAVRYHVAFDLIGSPIDATTALALACIGVIAMMVPFVNNGLGLREWAIGLLAPLLSVQTLELSMTAELVNRAAEIVTVLVLGLAGTAWVTHRVRRVTTVTTGS